MFTISDTKRKNLPNKNLVYFSIEPQHDLKRHKLTLGNYVLGVLLNILSKSRKISEFQNLLQI